MGLWVCVGLLSRMIENESEFVDAIRAEFAVELMVWLALFEAAIVFCGGFDRGDVRPRYACDDNPAARGAHSVGAGAARSRRARNAPGRRGNAAPSGTEAR